VKYCTETGTTGELESETVKTSELPPAELPSKTLASLTEIVPLAAVLLPPLLSVLVETGTIVAVAELVAMLALAGLERVRLNVAMPLVTPPAVV